MVMVSKEAFIKIVKFIFMSPWSGVIGLGSIGFLYALIFLKNVKIPLYNLTFSDIHLAKNSIK